MHLVTNPQITPTLRAALVELWVAIANAGGSVGLPGRATSERVLALAEPALARIEDGRDDLVVAFADERPVGFGFLETNDAELSRHWATIRRLQRDPDRRRQGIGAAVLTELEAAAHRRGLTMVCLTVRGGTGRERFYLARGYQLDGALPDRLQLDDGTRLEEIRLSRRLDATGTTVRLALQLLDDALPVPRYAHPGDAGIDLHARTGVTLKPGQRATVPTGVAVAVPIDHVGLVHPRSGLAVRSGVTLVNAPGTIDAGYRGEINVALINTDTDTAVVIERGDRIAQLVIQRVERAHIDVVEELPSTARGTGGFGSTGR